MITVKLEIDDNSGCVIKKGRKIMDWRDLTREEQVSILNTFENFYALFYRFLKEEVDEALIPDYEDDYDRARRTMGDERRKNY